MSVINTGSNGAKPVETTRLTKKEGPAGRKEGESQKQADGDATCCLHLSLCTHHGHHVSAWTLCRGRACRA